MSEEEVYVLTDEMIEALDAIAKREEEVNRPWPALAVAIVKHYYAEGYSIKTICRLLEEVYPKRDWSYAKVNSRVQYLKKTDCI